MYIYLPWAIKVVSLALSASEVTLKDMGTINWYQNT